MISKPELLAPAGDLERLKIALKYGADAVYIGGPALGLRANAINFTMDEIKQAVDFAHKMSKKVYVTVNIVIHEEELDGVVNYLERLDKIGVDAIIVSDPIVIDLALKKTKIPVHLSTQASTMNREAAQFFKDLGVSRIVLARECSYDEIKSIIDNVPIEIETFIHGAMCAGVSGRCVMSNFLTNRDANRGGCSQICRWDFDLLEENGQIIEGEKPFTFCSKDLSMLKHIPKMIDMGIKSFKIEGRMRSAYYIATVVSIYRKVIDDYCQHQELFTYDIEQEKILRRVANRDSQVQFFDGNCDETCSYYNGREEISNQDFLGIVLDYDDDTQMATVQQRNYFKKGDKAEIFGPNHDTFDYIFDEIWDENDELIDVVRHPKQVVKFKINHHLDKDDMIRIKY